MLDPSVQPGHTWSPPIKGRRHAGCSKMQTRGKHFGSYRLGAKMFLMISIYFYFTCQCAPQFSLGYKMLETTLKDNCNFLGFSKSPHLCEGKLVTDRSSVSFLIHIMLHTLRPVIFILFFFLVLFRTQKIHLDHTVVQVLEGSFWVLFCCNFDLFHDLEESFRVHFGCNFHLFYGLEESFWVLFGYNYDLSFDGYIFV